MEATTIDIIGAGLGGTALALALQQKSIKCQIWESRVPDAPEQASGVVLSPNGLRVLDSLGVLERIKDRCWKSEHRTYKNDKDETTSKTVVTSEEVYGYKNHRVWRRLLLDEMKLMLQERSVPIKYNAKFEGITSDSATEGVTFRINGEEKHTDLLVGADGIYSTVRKHIAAAMPEYTGTVGVISHINRDMVAWPYPEFEKQCTIQGKPGAFFMLPEVADGSEIMVGTQAKFPDRSRSEWEELSNSPEKMTEFFTKGYDDWHPTARSIIDAVCKSKDTLYLWPFLRLPRLDEWYSSTGRVIIVGDGAHALPPSSAQGVNQALEDIYSLSILLKESKGQDLRKHLRFWQDMRQARIDAVIDWYSTVTDVQRMPEADRQKLIREGKVKDPKSTQGADHMRWLYLPDTDEQIQHWLNVQL